jgi:hypothetical protein
VSAIIVNNILHGFDATGTRGLVQNKRNLIIPQKGFKGFVPKRYFFMNPDIFDYRLKASSPAINSGIDPGTALGVSLTPKWHYLHISKKQKRVISGKIDLGAYEFN